ncbi:hypothetical protein [Sinorhizobium medicae]|uniref:hypothetical protein n=1 Tax=Sinorhizobium medicae TaxID=110321 RepID=UPI000FDCB1E2|nr:hypothetical protein [Sinorhizobium medicae]RVI59070.1 hypothetical protein CN192_05790 [Sinorhizobium medicae]
MLNRISQSAVVKFIVEVANSKSGFVGESFYKLDLATCANAVVGKVLLLLFCKQIEIWARVVSFAESQANNTQLSG